MFGARVPKSDPRVGACGAVDELNAALGIVRAFGEDRALAAEVFAVQNELVTVMGELSVSPENRARYLEKGFLPVTGAMVERLTRSVDELEARGLSFQHWATPGATRAGALLDVARTVCRRAEREVVGLGEVNPEIVRYLNRLSDLCWLWARWTETEAERETQRGRDLGLKKERETEEAEADIAKG